MILGDCLRERIFILFVFWPCHAAREILVRQAGIEPEPQQWKHQIATSGLPGSFWRIFFFLAIIFFFNWSIITFQCCAGFCYTTTWASYVYTYIPSLIPTPWGHHTEVSSLCCTAASHYLSFFFFFLISKRSLLGSQTTDPSENWQDQWTLPLRNIQHCIKFLGLPITSENHPLSPSPEGKQRKWESGDQSSIISYPWGRGRERSQDWRGEGLRRLLFLSW